MPRIKKREAELKNEIIERLIVLLDENVLSEMKKVEEDAPFIEGAYLVVRNALERRKSIS